MIIHAGAPGRRLRPPDPGRPIAMFDRTTTGTPRQYATVQDKMASRSVNKVILIGHLGKDAETKFTPNGVARSNFTLATNRRWKDQQSGEFKEVTDWHNIVL